MSPITIRAKLLAGVAALGCVMLATSQANATAFAYSALEVSNFTLNVGQFGGFTSFDFLIQPRSVTIGASTENADGAASSTQGASLDVNPLIHSLGTAYGTNNQYFGVNKPNAGDIPFAVTDAFMLNTNITSGSQGAGGHFGVQSGAGNACVPACSVGAASQSGTDLSLQWNFVVADGASGNLTWDFDEIAMRVAATTDNNETAVARLHYTISVSGPQNFEESFVVGADPNINSGESTSVPGQNIEGSYSESTTHHTSSFFINTAGQYSFNILFDAATNVRANGDTPLNLPEPGTLGLIGLGLIGLGAAGLRRKQLAA